MSKPGRPDRSKNAAGDWCGRSPGWERPKRSITSTPGRCMGWSPSSTSTRWRWSGSMTTRRAPRRRAGRGRITMAGVRRRATISSRSSSPNRRDRVSRSMTIVGSAGRSGRSSSASIPARDWCCTMWRTTMPGRGRQICHRASIAELVIPYGDPNPTVHFKNVFDTGEYGLGPLVNSLSLGCDCLGEIRYLDVVSNAAGRFARA